MGISVGPGTNHCTYRSSVVGDASDVAPDTEVVATGTVGRNTPAALQGKAFVGIGVRQSEEAGWELRVLPGAQKWQLLRDPPAPRRAQTSPARARASSSR